MTEIAALRPRTYRYLSYDADKNKKVKSTRRCVIKQKLKFEDNKYFLEVTQHENKICHLETNENDVDSFKKDHKEFIKNNKLILKTQQRFRSERHNIFTEEINKVALSSNDDKRMQSIGSIEINAYGTSEDLVNDRIKSNNIIKENKND